MAYGTNKKKAAPKPKPKAQPKPKKDLIESYMELPMAEKIFKAPGYIASAPIYYSAKAGEKMAQMKSDYDRGKKMRTREEFRAAGGKTIREKVGESVKQYNKMQEAKKKQAPAPKKKVIVKKSK
jgi:hypothetical protein